MIELLRRFMGVYRTKSIVAVVLKTVEVVFEVLTPLVVARMVDEGVGTGDVGVVVGLGLLLVVFSVLSYGSTFVCQRLAAQVSQGVGTDIRNALFKQVNTLSSADVDRIGTPSLVTRVTNDVNQVQLAVALGIRTLLRWPLLAAGSMVAACAIDLRLGLVFLVCLPAIGLVFGLVMRASIPFYRAMQAKLDRISQITRETLFGMRVIRAFRQETAEELRARHAIYDQAKTSIGVGRLSAVLNPATFVVMNAGIAAILFIGAPRVYAGDLTTGEVIAFVSYMTQSLTSVSYLANLVVVLMRGQTSAGRILEVLDCEPSVTDACVQPIVPDDAQAQAAPALSIENVSFAYGSADAKALAGVELELGAGQTLGVIGGTGSGKSTLVWLLARLYDPDAGTVRVFGTDVRAYPLKQLRSLVSIVPQNVSLVSGTVRSNLCWRNPQATDGELWEALRHAQAADFVEALDGRLDARVEAGGQNFSGGQRQRLTIARALVGHPRVVVLDDAASALDFATDARLRADLRALRSQLTSVIVSQRVSAVMSADKILVLDHGRMAGLGTHEELLGSCGIYREICESQLRREEVEHG